jgi:tRNA 2-selenouridine synthase
MAWLFETAGIECKVLKGGYKAYRNQLLQDFGKIKNLIVIHGETGCGKTEILKVLARRGEQIMDLEHFAKHRGSAFGAIGFEPQPTTMQFQNDLHHCLLHYNQSRRIWVEGESQNIGKVYLPDTLWSVMNQAVVINIVMPKNLRVRRIVNEYGKFPVELLFESIHKIEKRFGGDKTKKVLKLVAEGQMDEAVDMLLYYYDRNYEFSLKNFIECQVIELKTDSADVEVNTDLIMNVINDISKNG